VTTQDALGVRIPQDSIVSIDRRIDVGPSRIKTRKKIQKNIDYGSSGRNYAHIKTTVELDDIKLENIMASMNFKTRKEAIDWALTEGERLAVMQHIKANPWSASVLREGMDPDYDVLAARRAVRTHKEE